MLLGLLVYGYATGVFSSRKLERATYDSVAFRFIAANDHPDHDTISVAFRRRFLDRDRGAVRSGLAAGARDGRSEDGHGISALDGTKIHANASRHSAPLSYEHAGRIEAQLKAEVAALLAKAEAADAADVPDGMSIPEELARGARSACGKSLRRARRSRRAPRSVTSANLPSMRPNPRRGRPKPAATGKKPGGKPPEPPTAGPLPKDQINLTDEESRIMPVAGGGFDQCCNAQAAVAAGNMLVVAADVVQAPNDKQRDRADAGQA